jgi:GNAT superfamily N-acetyltransferase
MRGATESATQWAGIVALVRLQGEHVPGGTLIEEDGMVASVVPVAVTSSIVNTALHGMETAVSFVATLPHARGKRLAAGILRRLLLDARERRQETASLQASQAGRPLYERLGFTSVGSLHFYEQRFPST